MSQLAYLGFPLDANGFVNCVLASIAVAPFTYSNALKYDALGRLVVSG